MMEEVAFVFRFPPSELDRLTLTKLHQWHRAARRIQKQTRGTF